MGILSVLFGKKDSKALSTAIKEGALLVDVRTRAEFSSGSVKGAINIPLDTISMQSAKLKGNKKIIVFCQSGARSGMAKRLLERIGFQQVINGGSWRDVNKTVQNT